MKASLHVTLVFATIFAQMTHTSGNRCRFPRSWRGNWYQNGVGEVVVRDHVITKKGVCKEHHGDYYLIKNKEEHCYQCLLILDRHPNIIQYKESYCIGRDSLQHICAQIRVEAILYTLVREPATSVPCPFQDAYHFTYNNNTGGFCRSPTSYVQSCAGDAQFRFNYKKCDDAAYTHDTSVDFECLATWKDGSALFMYGAFGPKDLNKDDRYRCFIYQVFGTVVYLSVSADATCRGLRSARDGPLVMEFTKDQFGWPRPQCALPDWFTEDTWEDLGLKFIFRPQSRGQILDVYAQKKDLETLKSKRSTTAMQLLQPQQRSTLKCLKIQSRKNSRTSFVAVAFSSHECESQYQCVRLLRRHRNVVEVHLALGLTPQSCPYPGRHQVTSAAPKCQLHLESACDESSLLSIHSSCVAHPVGKLQCLQQWKEGKLKYLIARRIDGNINVANCFMLRDGSTSHSVELSTARRCNLGTRHVLHHPITYEFNKEIEACSRPAIATEVTEIQLDDATNKNILVSGDTYNNAEDSNAMVRLPESHKNYEEKTPPKNKASKLTFSLLFLVVTLCAVR